MSASVDGAVFVVPKHDTDWPDAPGVWVTIAGWAAAARKRFGSSWVVTRDGVRTAEQVYGFTGRSSSAASTNRERRSRLVQGSRLVQIARTGAKDAARTREALRFRDVGERPEWGDANLAFVWEHHDLFHRWAEPLAKRHGCPVVSYVHAPQVWEARQWGVHRPGWGRFLERLGERPSLLAADVVACVSDEVVDEVVRLGVSPERTLVSPMAVDADMFNPAVSGDAVRRSLGLTDRFVVGWTGTFRKFHGLEILLEAFARFRSREVSAVLLLVGQGAGRPMLEESARRLRIEDAVVFAGSVAGTDLPRYVAAMDVTVVSAPADQAFHYSPQKLREYLAAGKPALAPAIGDVNRTLTDETDGLLYQPGDHQHLFDLLERLHSDLDLRERLGVAGRRLMERSGTWDVRLEQLSKALRGQLD
jgi:glycosyltransferase involved in cell wall biosynthesis